MNKVELMRRLIAITMFLVKSGVCPEAKRDFAGWWKLVKFCHSKGYLYAGYDKDVLDIVVIGYKVKSLEESVGKMPLIEEGNILYVPVLASNSKDPLKMKRMLNAYFDNNNDVDRIAYRWRGRQHDLRQKKLRRHAHV